jgi:hypothetical protein
MNVELLCLRHDIGAKEAKRKGFVGDKHPEMWQVKDGEDWIHVWIDENGFHCVRMSISVANGRATEHPSHLKWDEFVDKIEKQLRLF